MADEYPPVTYCQGMALYYGKEKIMALCPMCGADEVKVASGVIVREWSCGTFVTRDHKRLSEHGNCLRRQLAAMTTAKEQAETQRNDLLGELADLQERIASAFGWDMHGETFIDAIKRVIAENKANKDQHPAPVDPMVMSIREMIEGGGVPPEWQR